MTLDEAIIHAESEAWKNEREADRCSRYGGSAYEEKAKSCRVCANEHRQLAEWLKELREHRAKIRLQICSVTGKPYSECGTCDYFKCTADEPICSMRIVALNGAKRGEQLYAEKMLEKVQGLKEECLLNCFSKTEAIEKFFDENWLQILDMLDDALYAYLNDTKIK